MYKFLDTLQAYQRPALKSFGYVIEDQTYNDRPIHDPKYNAKYFHVISKATLGGDILSAFFRGYTPAHEHP